MLLTRKSAATDAARPSALVSSLARGIGRAIPTMDRRAFLRRSGLGVGAGMAASQLVLVKKAQAADPKGADGAKTVVVKRTVCRCSTRRSTSVPIAPRAPRCARTATASTVCARR